MDQDNPPPTSGNQGGRFRKGVSGNPDGRPPRALVRRDSAGGKPAVRRDGWINTASGHGTRRDRRMLTQFGVDIVTDIEARMLWRTEFLCARIIEDGPTEELRRGWAIGMKDQGRARKLSDQAKALGMDAALRQARWYQLALGGGVIFPVLEGALGNIEEPLDETRISSVDALHVFEPQELMPESYYSDVTNPKFRLPETYRLQPLTTGRMGYTRDMIIHESRLAIFQGIKVSVQTQPGQREGWGDSVLCRPRQVIADFGLAWGSAATLLASHGGGTLMMDQFTSMMGSPNGRQQFADYVAAQEQAMSTLRIMVIDAKDRFEKNANSLTGLSDTLDEFKTLMAAAAGRPVSILMGRGAGGLHTDDQDTRSWYATVQGDRSEHLEPRHHWLLRLMMLASSGPCAGQEQDGWTLDYPALWSPTDAEVATTRKTNMERAVAAVQAQIASPDDIADSFYGEDGSGDLKGDIKINFERREEQAQLASGPGDINQEDAAAMGYEPDDDGDGGEDGDGGDGGVDLSEDDLADLQALQDEFGDDAEAG